jgi:hypothetical protein
MTPHDKREVLDQREPGTDDAQDPASVPEHLFSQYGLNDPAVKPGPAQRPDNLPVSGGEGSDPLKSRPRSRSPAAPRR